MDMLAESVDAVIGMDTHTDTHTACLLDAAGREIGVVTVEATPRGCGNALAWALDHAVPAEKYVRAGHSLFGCDAGVTPRSSALVIRR